MRTRRRIQKPRQSLEPTLDAGTHHRLANVRDPQRPRRQLLVHSAVYSARPRARRAGVAVGGVLVRAIAAQIGSRFNLVGHGHSLGLGDESALTFVGASADLLVRRHGVRRGPQEVGVFRILGNERNPLLEGGYKSGLRFVDVVGLQPPVVAKPRSGDRCDVVVAAGHLPAIDYQIAGELDLGLFGRRFINSQPGIQTKERVVGDRQASQLLRRLGSDTDARFAVDKEISAKRDVRDSIVQSHVHAGPGESAALDADVLGRLLGCANHDQTDFTAANDAVAEHNRLLHLSMRLRPEENRGLGRVRRNLGAKPLQRQSVGRAGNQNGMLHISGSDAQSAQGYVLRPVQRDDRFIAFTVLDRSATSRFNRDVVQCGRYFNRTAIRRSVANSQHRSGADLLSRRADVREVTRAVLGHRHSLTGSLRRTIACRRLLHAVPRPPRG